MCGWTIVLIGMLNLVLDSFCSFCYNFLTESSWEVNSKVHCLLLFGEVVFIGNISAFYVILVPLEYVPTIPSHSAYIIDICFVLCKTREGPQHISSTFLTAQ